MGFGFQDFNLLPQITAYDNVERPLLFGQVGKKERARRAGRIVEIRDGRIVREGPSEAAA